MRRADRRRLSRALPSRAPKKSSNPSVVYSVSVREPQLSSLAVLEMSLLLMSLGPLAWSQHPLPKGPCHDVAKESKTSNVNVKGRDTTRKLYFGYQNSIAAYRIVYSNLCARFS